MAAKRKGGLGKGIDSLIPQRKKPDSEGRKNDKKEDKLNETDLKQSVNDSSDEINGLEDYYEENEKNEPADQTSESSKSDNKAYDDEIVRKNTEGNSAEEHEEGTEGGNSKGDQEYSPEKGESVVIMKISAVEPNRDQPRKNFREEGIEELASSIKQYGIIQPLLVQRRDDYYEIIAGERRWRAAMKAGLKEVPVIVKDYSNREAVEISLIENIQREDLNPIEEALAYERLINEFELTQEEVAGRVSKSRSAVTNSLRLLKLEGDVRQMVVTGEISEGHARTLLGLNSYEMQKLLADRIIKEKLSVRDTEKLVKKLTDSKPKKTRTRDYEKEAVLNNLSEQLKAIFETKVSIVEKAGNKGKIEIEYYSDDELNRIYEMLQSLR